MTLTLEWGTIAEARAAGIEDMLALQWEEIDDERERIPLAIDWPSYFAVERQGFLKVLLLRKDGQLIGYSVWFVRKPLHHRLATWAINDFVYVEPEHRKGRTGVFLIKEGERMLRTLDVQVINYNVKPEREKGGLGYQRGRDSVGFLLARLGYAHTESAWTKYF